MPEVTARSARTTPTRDAFCGARGRQFLVVNAGQSLADAQADSDGNAAAGATPAPGAAAGPSPSRAYVVFALPAQTR